MAAAAVDSFCMRARLADPDRPPSRLASCRIARAAHRFAPHLAVVGLLLVLLVPVIAAQRGGTAGAKDQEYFHLPTIVEYAGDFPGVDLDEHNGAMSPGYHLVLTPVGRYLSTDRPVLIAFAAIFTLLLGAALVSLFARYVDGWLAFALTLPVVCSHYVVQGGGWLITDNAALLFVVLTLGSCLAIVRGRDRFAAAGLSSLAAVWIRQIHFWTAGLIALAWLLGPRDRRTLPRAGLAILLPVLGLAALVAAWGSITPPRFRDETSFQPSAIAFALALIGPFGTPYLVAAWRSTRGAARAIPRDRLALAAGAFGALSALAVPTSASDEARRTGGGLWLAVEKAPVVADRSLLLAALAAWGGVVVVQWWRIHRDGERRPEAILVLLGLAGFVAAHVFAPDVYQRYYEPVFLIGLGLLTALALGARGAAVPAVRRRALLAVGVLTLVQLAGTAVEVYRSMADAPPIERSYEETPTTLEDGD